MQPSLRPGARPIFGREAFRYLPILDLNGYPWAMANVLPFLVRVRVIRALVEGVSIRGTSRLTGTDKDVVMRLGVTVGQGCMKLHDRLVRDIPAYFLEVDETWTFVGRHEKRKLATDPPWFGDQYTMFALDPDTKLVPSYKTGKRTLETATSFMHDLRARVTGRPQISVDGWPDWVEAIRRAFSYDGADVGSIVKEYQKACKPTEDAEACGRVKSSEKTTIFGEPIEDFVSTSMAERLNLTVRMHQRRLTRLTNAYSRKKDNLVAAAGLHYFWYNFVREHDAISTTPAMAAQIADHPWTVEEMTRAALEEMGEMNRPTHVARPRRYERKTHTDIVC